MKDLRRIRNDLLQDLKEFYEGLRSESSSYGELKKKICMAALQEKFSDQTYENLVEEKLIQFYERDVRSLPIRTQTADGKSDAPQSIDSTPKRIEEKPPTREVAVPVCIGGEKVEEIVTKASC